MNYKQFQTIELTFHALEPNSSWTDIPLSGSFVRGENVYHIRGFYAGNNIYKVRFCTPMSGKWHYEIKGLVNEKGSFNCVSDDQMHGLVQAQDTHFIYQDGKKYIPFGTTVYALWYQKDSLITQTLDTLRYAPFNKVRICLFPKYFDYNHEEPSLFPFEKNDDGHWNMHKPNLKFWEHIENIIVKLNQMDIQCDLILFHPYDKWGFAKLSLAEAKTYISYAINRLAAYPNIWWSLANEFDLMDYTTEDWHEIAKTIHEKDCYHHLLSIHNMLAKWDFSDQYTSHVCLQLKNVDEISKIIKQYHKPVVIDECCYEGNIPFEWGNISGFELVNRFWKIYLQGGYCSHGETFESDDNVLWWSKGGTLKGQSPKCIAFLKQIIYELPGNLVFTGIDLTSEEASAMKNNPPQQWANSSYKNLARYVTGKDIEEMLLSARIYTGAVKDEAFITYYDRHCTCRGEMILPDTRTYTIEKIDVWHMTRQKVMEHVNGHITVSLPGREGMALLAMAE